MKEGESNDCFLETLLTQQEKLGLTYEMIGYVRFLLLVKELLRKSILTGTLAVDVSREGRETSSITYKLPCFYWHVTLVYKKLRKRRLMRW